ncbi:MAG: hypothetical protein WBG46_08090 [Nonlabens sp.]
MKRIVLLFVLIAITNACSFEQNQINFIFENGEVLSTDKFSFITEKGSVFIKLKDESEKVKVFSEAISKVTLNVGDTTYTGNGMYKDYSRETDRDPFVYLIDNKDHNINSMKIRGEKLIFIGFEKDISKTLQEVEFEELE